MEQQREVSLPGAAANWYDTVYLPVVDAIRTLDVLFEFPSRTEADLYLWVAYQRERLHDVDGRTPQNEEAADHLAQQFSERPVISLIKTVRRVIRAAAEAAVESPEPPTASGEEEQVPSLFSR